MKKAIKELKQKEVKELIKEEKNLRSEIAKIKLEFKVNPPKDTNTLFKKKKKLAQILTIIREQAK